MMTPALDSARRHPLATGLVGAVATVILIRAHDAGDAGRAVAYLAVVVVSVLFIDLVVGRSAGADRPVPVRGAGVEIGVLGLSFAVGLAWLYARFVADYQPPPGLLRLAWLALLIGCVFSALPAVFLLARRYRLSDLGFRLSGLAAMPLVLATFAAASLVLFPGAVTWRGIVAETGGSWSAILFTALLAAVPEEFLRFAWQTRVGAWLQRPAVGWLVASVVWASLHGPKDWSESHAIGDTVMGMVDILPLGLLWGYLTRRTGSMLPSVLLHLTNVWGLQNLA